MAVSIGAVYDLDTDTIEATTPAGARLRMAADAAHGSDVAAGPKETLLAALAACTSSDVASILRKKRQDAREYNMAVSGETADEHPQVFTRILVEHRVSGDVTPEALRRSIELSATRYCPISAMLSAVARVEHRYLLTDASGATHVATVAVVGPDRRIQVNP